MAIAVTCSGCGKTLKVKDELLGKNVRCPGCGTTFLAKAGGVPKAGPGGAGGVGGKKKDATPAVSISPGVLILGGVAAGLVALTLFWIFGPGAARARWAELEPKAHEQVNDVVNYVLRVKFAEAGGLDTKRAVPVPESQGVVFPFGLMMMSLPEEMVFSGTTPTGRMTGTWNTRTGEVKANIETDGMSTSTGVLVRPGTQSMQITGRSKDGTVTAEENGKALVEPPPRKRSEDD